MRAEFPSLRRRLRCPPCRSLSTSSRWNSETQPVQTRARGIFGRACSTCGAAQRLVGQEHASLAQRFEENPCVSRRLCSSPHGRAENPAVSLPARQLSTAAWKSSAAEQVAGCDAASASPVGREHTAPSRRLYVTDSYHSPSFCAGDDQLWRYGDYLAGGRRCSGIAYDARPEHFYVYTISCRE